MNTLFSLAGRRAVVTGAASGIGSAIAQVYAQAGAALVLADLDGDRLDAIVQHCREFGVTVVPVQADVGDEPDANRIIDRCIASFGGIDILVNNAGMLTQARCVDLTTQMWDDMLRVDLRSVFLCTRRALPSMLAQRWGRVINVASQLGIKGGAELSHYAAAKAGVIGLTKSLAREVAPDNVLVNAIAPGPIETPLVDGISAAWKAAKSAELPLRRFGRADEVAPAALLLASDPGGNLFVGQTLGPNSGDVMP
ncbi:SDR family NAD(P)-dependent oxidoreductase [Burkholderia pseudomultivorans]|uniref:3-oxoacyl-(Acyl-carrier-protein) reductase FabG n=1 Tax=Burkholderia pseudomultivorans TaxID=1207504 RepID=A0A6P2LJ61_9BURK|nr:SDR family oxidoreductase [Burkholderia pseudomultivorans]MDR8730886.1 3-oxoacyl-(acyl-carrier-protein) reductase FabG [Burkholderia pseudomultivorans]MDR8738661.1 3-oxoacyl-(acyl-carrier-protein) reductase FabG [Burkholderia pseudomultivorans]MDR8745166.1 3-oxoacyl-(acyl-carrier-protein) reductase FabG [Burkholderia pseudomultivorans]MDR8757200.1 3-oxoacyl-(acyl-carrier-protein) reductase FabG [Burkholderia pseudomultivorans]MDR8781534.1 3-oxoacyl-(acyl-carrier-protein) reductase FabG [Bur